MIKLTEILKTILFEIHSNKSIEEMADSDPDFIMIMSKYKTGTNEERSTISSALGLGLKSTEEEVYNELRDAGKEDMEYIKKELGIQDLKEACWDGYRQDGTKKGKKGNMVPNCVKVREEKKGPKLNSAYLTKDAAQMKKDIKARKNLKSDDPAAYTKWDADYIDKDRTKKYKTKKSASTTAYEKRFGKKKSK